VANGMTITAAEIATLTYTPAADANGSARSTFDFAVNDADSGTVSATMTIHVTAEYFGAVDSYDLLEATDFRAQTTGASIPMSVPYGLDDVLNLGIGVDYRFSDRVSLYGGYTSDRSARLDSNRMTITGWDIHHLTFGSAFQALDIDVTAGFGYSWGSSVEWFSVATEVDPEGPVFEVRPVRYEFDYSKLKFILGFTFQF